VGLVHVEDQQREEEVEDPQRVGDQVSLNLTQDSQVVLVHDLEEEPLPPLLLLLPLNVPRYDSLLVLSAMPPPMLSSSN